MKATPIEPSLKVFSVRLPSKLVLKAKMRALKEGRSVQDLVALALTEYLTKPAASRKEELA